MRCNGCGAALRPRRDVLVMVDDLPFCPDCLPGTLAAEPPDWWREHLRACPDCRRGFGPVLRFLEDAAPECREAMRHALRAAADFPPEPGRGT